MSIGNVFSVVIFLYHGTFHSSLSDRNLIM